jgi:error-prone DNA polymerase
LAHHLVERAVERGLDALALTDRDTLSGSVRFAKAGIRPVFGADLAVLPVRATARLANRRRPVRGGAFIDEDAPRIVLLARDRAGWSSLCRLISAAHARQSTTGGQVLVTFE